MILIQLIGLVMGLIIYSHLLGILNMKYGVCLVKKWIVRTGCDVIDNWWFVGD